jgi:hypothetical protein
MSNINDSFNYTRFDKNFAKLMCFEQNGTLSPPFSQTIQAVLAIGRNSHRCAQINKAKKGAANGLFLAKFGAKTTSLFAMYTM